MRDLKPDRREEMEGLEATVEQEEAAAAEAETRAAEARAHARALRQAHDTIQADDDPDKGGGDTGREMRSTASTRRGRLRLPSRKATAVAVALAITVGSLAASGFMVWHHLRITDERQRQSAFTDAARQGVVNLMTIDFNQAKENVQRVIDSSTGDFKKDFETNADGFVTAALQSQTVTTATINDAAVESMTSDSAVVLVAATSRVTNTAGAKDTPRAWRLSVTMTKGSGQPKISKVEFVP